jgi:hypothetical protein
MNDSAHLAKIISVIRRILLFSVSGFICAIIIIPSLPGDITLISIIAAILFYVWPAAVLIGLFYAVVAIKPLITVYPLLIAKVRIWVVTGYALILIDSILLITWYI